MREALLLSQWAWEWAAWWCSLSLLKRGQPLSAWWQEAMLFVDILQRRPASRAPATPRRTSKPHGWLPTFSLQRPPQMTVTGTQRV